MTIYKDCIFRILNRSIKTRPKLNSLTALIERISTHRQINPTYLDWVETKIFFWRASHTVNVMNNLFASQYYNFLRHSKIIHKPILPLPPTPSPATTPESNKNGIKINNYSVRAYSTDLTLSKKMFVRLAGTILAPNCPYKILRASQKAIIPFSTSVWNGGLRSYYPKVSLVSIYLTLHFTLTIAWGKGR